MMRGAVTTPRDAKEILILQMLAGGEELYGLQMVERSGGRLRRGLIYVTLAALEDAGQVEGRPEAAPAGGLLPRRLYKIKPAGRAVLAEAAGERCSGP